MEMPNTMSRKETNTMREIQIAGFHGLQEELIE